MMLVGAGKAPWTTPIQAPLVQRGQGVSLVDELAGSVDLGLIGAQEKAARALANSPAAVFAATGIPSGADLRTQDSKKNGYDLAALSDKAFSVIDPANFRNETPRVRFPLPSIEQGNFMAPVQIIKIFFPDGLRVQGGKRSMAQITSYEVEYIFAALVYHCLDGLAERLTPEVVRKQGEPLLRVWNYQLDLKSLYNAYKPDPSVVDQFGPLHGSKLRCLIEAVHRILKDPACQIYDHNTGIVSLRSSISKSSPSPVSDVPVVKSEPVKDVAQALDLISKGLKQREELIRTLRADVSRLTAEKASAILDLETRQAELDDKEKEFDALGALAGKRGVALDLARTQVEELKANMAALEKKLAEANEKIGSMEAQLAELHEAGRRDQEKLKRLRSELEEGERQVELADKTATLEARIGELEDQAKKSVTRIEEFKSRVKDLERENKRLAGKLAEAEARVTKAEEERLTIAQRLTNQLMLSSGALEKVASLEGPLVSLARLVSADKPDVEAMGTAVLDLATSLTNGLGILTGQPMGPLRRNLFSAIGDDIITSSWLSFVSGDAFRAIIKKCAAQCKEQMRADLLLLAEEVMQKFLDAIRTDEALGTKYHRGRALDIVLDTVYADFEKRVLPEYDKKSVASDLKAVFKAQFRQAMAGFAFRHLPEEFQLS